MEPQHGSSCNSRSNPRWQLPTVLQLHILSLLPPNERALSGRLVSPETRDDLIGPQHCTASLSQPLPRHAAPWAVAAGQEHMRQLPFWHRRQLLCTAAASGCEVNLEVALSLLSPCYFSGDLESCATPYYQSTDPGVAAVKAGHTQLLGWLLRHCPALLRAGSLLEAAARHCSLAVLQAVWETVQGEAGSSTGPRPALGQAVLDAAARSATPDALAKMQWVLEAGGGSCSLTRGTASIAMDTGDVERLRWLRERGCTPYIPDQFELGLTLGGASLPVAQWLVDEAECQLPKAGAGTRVDPRYWEALLKAAARGRDFLVKMLWLQDRDGLLLDGSTRSFLLRLPQVAAEAGNLEALQLLLAAVHPAFLQYPEVRVQVLQHVNADDATLSESIPVVACLRSIGAPLTARAYDRPASLGHLPLGGWCARHRYLPVGWTCQTSSGGGQTATRPTAGTCCRRCSCWWARRGAGTGVPATCCFVQSSGATWPWCSTCMGSRGIRGTRRMGRR